MRSAAAPRPAICIKAPNSTEPQGTNRWTSSPCNAAGTFSPTSCGGLCLGRGVTQRPSSTSPTCSWPRTRWGVRVAAVAATGTAAVLLLLLRLGVWCLTHLGLPGLHAVRTGVARHACTVKDSSAPAPPAPSPQARCRQVGAPTAPSRASKSCECWRLQLGLVCWGLAWPTALPMTLASLAWHWIEQRQGVLCSLQVAQRHPAGRHAPPRVGKRLPQP